MIRVRLSGSLVLDDHYEIKQVCTQTTIDDSLLLDFRVSLCIQDYAIAFLQSL